MTERDQKQRTPAYYHAKMSMLVHESPMDLKAIKHVAYTCWYFQAYGVPGFEKKER